MILPGIVSVTFKTKSIKEVLEIAKQAGLAAIEWSENHHIAKGDIECAKATALLTKEYGLEIAGYGSYYRLGENMDIIPSLETAKALGTNNVRIWAGSKPSSALSREERESLIAELVDAVNIARRYDIVLNLEWHKNTLTDENESGLDVLKRVNNESLRTLWQPTQALTFEERKTGLKQILPYLSYLHVYYWDESGRRPFEEGIDMWKSYFSILDSDKKYYALLEFVLNDNEEQFYKDAAILKDLLQKGV